MDRLDAMEILLAVVEAGSLSGAARRTGTPLATVSRKISELEAHLKTRLFNRSSRRIVLTDAGRTYVAACERILEDIGEAERAASGEYSVPRGDLVITAPIVFGRLHVLPVVAEFLAAYPEIDIRLALSDRVAALLDDHIDVGLRIGALPDSSLIALRIGMIRQIVCGSPDYFSAHGVPRKPEALAAHRCIAFEGLTPGGAWIFRNGGALMSVPVRARLSVNTAEAAIDAALSGLGMTRVLSYQVAVALKAGSLRAVLTRYEPEPWPVSLVYPGQGRLPLKLRAFLDFAAPRLKRRLTRM